MKMPARIQQLREHGWAGACLQMVMAGVFLFVLYIWLYHNTDLWNLWLPACTNNDEVVYNRQVAGVLAGGQPAGVFGYNESRAAVGHFGAWGPVLIWLYAIPGLLVGSGVNMMFWCNILLCVAGWVLFSCGARLTWKQNLVFVLALLFSGMPLPYLYSGTGEPSCYFLILAIMGSAVALQRGFRRWIFWLEVLLCAVVTVLRAYTVVFWIFPIAALWKSRRKHAVACIPMVGVSLAAYMVITDLFNAPFFSGGDVDFQAVQLLLQGKAGQAVQYQYQRVAQILQAFWIGNIWPTLTGDPTDIGCTGLILFLLMVTTGICIACDAARKRPIRFKVCALACVLISVAGLFSLYSLSPLARHFTMLMIPLLGALVCEGVAPVPAYLPLLLLLLVPRTELPELPVYDAGMDKQLQVVAEALTAQDEAQLSDDPWDHTLAYAFRDDVFHGYLYAVPDGMGIQFDRNTYLADPNNPIHSRYVMVEHGGDAEARLLDDGWQELVSTQDLVVYVCPQEPAAG